MEKLNNLKDAAILLQEYAFGYDIHMSLKEAKYLLQCNGKDVIDKWWPALIYEQEVIKYSKK